MKKVYLNEYNLEAGKSVFLPYSTGLLQAFAQQNTTIRKEYEFQPIHFRKDTVKNLVDKHVNPDVVGFSVVVWNYNLSLAVAKGIKEKYPNCLIVVGGPAIENNKEIFEAHPYVDLAVYGEGEVLFTKILLQNLGTMDIKETLSYFSKDVELDKFPSPYVAGIYDQILKDNPDTEFKALVECNRNCPFGCDYCFWGQPELNKKIKYHSEDYIRQDAEWIAKHEIDYVFCTDANFGMFKRDIDTATIYANTKKKYKFPEKFRVCYGKNAADSIFKTASVLNEANMDKLITLSVQSTNPATLQAVNRTNIKSDTFKKLQKNFSENGIATYTEFILGLPLETKQSFLDGLEYTLRTIGDNQIFVYPCLVLPNTKLASKEYREKYGLITRKLDMKVPHSNRVHRDWVKEIDEVVIGTTTMSVADWKYCSTISWIVQLFHSYNIGRDIVQYIHNKYNISYMEIYDRIYRFNIQEINDLFTCAEYVINHSHWSMYFSAYGDIYYEPEEMMYLHILADKERFYKELWQNLKAWLQDGLDLPVGFVFNLILKQIEQLPDTSNVNDWGEFAINTILKGGKDNNQDV